MRYTELTPDNMERVIPLYIDYYNNNEDSCWTHETVYTRLHQVVAADGAYGLIMELDGDIAGFVMGSFVQYDDGVTFDLIEIVIAKEHQGKGLGTQLYREAERRAKERGAFLVQLTSVNDASHDRFYKRLGFGDVTNMKLMSKLI